MYLSNNYKFSKISTLNFIIATIPLSLILGNLATNVNVIIVCILGLFIYKKQIFEINNKIYYYFIYLFFFYLILITLINNFEFLNSNSIQKDHFFKSIFYLRYLIFFLVIKTLVEKEDFDNKIFFLSCAFFSAIVSIDIVIQFLFKKNILGYSIIANKPSSFFKEELIAGGFIQKFSLFFIFLLVVKKKLNSFILIIFILFLIPIILSGNRMPIIIYIMSILLYFLIEKKFKEIIIAIIISSLTIFSFIKFPVSKRLHIDLNVFFNESLYILKKAPKLFLYNEGENIVFGGTGYLIHFNTGIQIWKNNKIFGNGLKSFRIKCTYENYQTCNTHPHNYFIELLVDVGATGAFLIYITFIIGLKNFLKFYYNEKTKIQKIAGCVFFLLIFFEFFPFRSTGSFFTTSNSAFIFLILPIFLNVKKLNKL